MARYVFALGLYVAAGSWGTPLALTVVPGSAITSTTAAASGAGISCSETGASFVSIDCTSSILPQVSVTGAASAFPGALTVSGAIAYPPPSQPLTQTSTASFSENVLITGKTGAGYFAFVLFPIGQTTTGTIGVSLDDQAVARSFNQYPPIYITSVFQFTFGTPFEFSMRASGTTDNLPHSFASPPQSVVSFTPALFSYQIFDKMPTYCGPMLPGEPPRTPPNAPCSDPSLPVDGALFIPEPGTCWLMLAGTLWICRARRLERRGRP